MISDNSTQSPNAAQIEYWNTVGGAAWAKYNDLLDRQISPLGLQAMRALDLKPGETVLDIGCGCGQTSTAIADRVGLTGSVIGIDISAPMLEIARSRPNPGTVEFKQADVQTDDLGTARYDVAFSRFGVMFFSEPVVAFSNIHQAVKAGGRLGFVCWQPLLANPWMLEPLDAVRHVLPPSDPPDPLAPGPFAFSDPARVQGILADSGFSNVDITEFKTRIGGGSVEESLQIALRVGPLGRALAEHRELLPQLAGPVREVLERHLTGEGVLMDASTWIVQASA